MEKSEQNPQKVVRKAVFVFSIGFFLVAGAVVGTLSYLIHRTHTYVQELSTYPQNYMVFWAKDSFRPPENRVISEKKWKEFLMAQKALENEIKKMKSAALLNLNAPADTVLKQIPKIREVEIKFFTKNHLSIRAYKWIAFQVLVSTGGTLLQQYNALAARVPMARPASHVNILLDSLPEENLQLFDKDRQQLARFHYLWVTAL